MRRILVPVLLIVSLLVALSAVTVVLVRTNALAALVATATPTATPTVTPTPSDAGRTAATKPPTPTATASATPTASPTTTPTPLKLNIKVEASAVKVGQGHPFFVRLTSNRPVTATATLEDRTIPLYLIGDGYVGVFAFSRFATLGPRSLIVNARDANGVTATDSLLLTVMATQFPAESLDVIPTPFDPTDFVKERNFLAPIWNTITPRQLWSGLFQRPVNGEVTSPFGEVRIWKDGSRDSHEGTDFNGTTGVPIFAAADGVVALAQPLVVRGNVVIIDHGLGVHSGYYHLSEILVKKDAPLKKGQLIGKMGATGRVTGPHLHWDMVVGGNNVDGLEWTTKEFNTNP